MDHAATTPVRPEVLDAMTPFFSEKFGNPSSLYALAQEARDAVDEARERVAAVLNARTSEIVFTGGGTESNNLALKGLITALKERGRHIVTTAIEHHAILHPAEQLETDGCEVTVVGCDEYGIIDPAAIEDAVRPETVLVSVMLANNEVGAVQDVAEIARRVKERSASLGGTVYVHTDAAQAAGKLPLDVRRLGVDMLSLTGHKIYAPKGVGVLYVKRGTPLEPLLAGGGQERQRRSGTENVPYVAGMGKALELAEAERPAFVLRVSDLRDRMEAGILERVPDAILNGHPEKRLPNISHMSFPGVEGEPVLLGLDFRAIAASSGSACSSASVAPSHVLMAMGLSEELAVGSIRLSLGKDSSEEDIVAVTEELPLVLESLRAMARMA